MLLRLPVPIYFSLMSRGKLRSCRNTVFRWVCAAVSSHAYVWERTIQDLEKYMQIVGVFG